MDQPMYTYSITPQQQEEHKLKKTGTFVALILLAMMLTDFVLTLVSRLGLLSGLAPLIDTYEGYMLFNMVVYVVCLAVPAVAVALISGHRQNPFPSKRVSGGILGISVFGGMAIAIFANVVASWLMTWLVMLGVPEPEMPDLIQPTLISLLLNIVLTAVLPALIEEMIFRGYILGALRAHGDGVAIVLSAVLFGVFHGNVLQIPFALLLGLVMGYLVVQTDSIWPSVLLHFANNLMSVLLSFFGKCYPAYQETIYSITFLVVTAVGAVILTVVRRIGCFRPIGNGISVFRVRERAGKLLSAPAMVLVLIAMLAVLFYSMGSGQV